MRICFVHSPEDYYDQNYGTRFIPLWAYYLASFVPEHWEIDILDCRVESAQSAKRADVFAFGGINQDITSMERTRKKLSKRFPQAKIILGGPITWSFEQEGKLHLLKDFEHLFVMDGEETLPKYLAALEAGTDDQLPKIIKADRFKLGEARELRFDLLDQKSHSYYGGVIEVSRGCPFYCEFCDIRVLPDNNRAHVKDIDLIVKEIDEFYKRGINKFQLACDNFIGDRKWAIECVDAILEWKERTNAQVSFFTWLTINLYKMHDLMAKMRRCGFSVLFIGIESVNQNSLLETAKVQNMAVLGDAVAEIHSYGFIIAPGLIFGFDSDDDNVFDDTASFIRDRGLLGGDPSFLMALAGTPLYNRMKRSGRLIERGDGAIERKKIQTNIMYLQDKDFLADGFLRFRDMFCNSKYQYNRYMSNARLILDGGKYIPIEDSGYAAVLPYVLSQFTNWGYLKMMMVRISYLLRPDRFWCTLKVWLFMKKNSKRAPDLATNFNYWLYTWTNLALKYKGLKVSDFGLQSVPENFDLEKVVELAERPEEEADKFRREKVKGDVQYKYTQKALQAMLKQKKAKPGSEEGSRSSATTA